MTSSRRSARVDFARLPSIALGVAMVAVPSGAFAQLSVQTINLGDVAPGLISENFVASGAMGTLTWSDLMFTVGNPALAATLTADGHFQWSTTSSAFGPYEFSATATDTAPFGIVMSSGVALTLNLVPEPATTSHAVLAAFGSLHAVRRRRGERRAVAFAGSPRR